MEKGATGEAGTETTLQYLEEPNYYITGIARKIKNGEALKVLIKEKLGEEALSRFQFVPADIGVISQIKAAIISAKNFVKGTQKFKWTNAAGTFKFDPDMIEVPKEHLTISSEDFDRLYKDKEDYKKKRAYYDMMQANFIGPSRFANILIRELEGKDLFMCSYSSIGAIAEISRKNKNFTDTVFYNRSKAEDLLRIISASPNGLKSLKKRVIDPGPFAESAQEIANYFGSTWAVSTKNVVKAAKETFDDESDNPLIQRMYASENHMCWIEFGDVNNLNIPGLTMENSIKVPESESIEVKSSLKAAV